MKTRWLLLAAGVTSCATTHALPGEDDSSDSQILSDAGALPDSALRDADADRDAGPCEDCEYFPEKCSDDALCPSGLFDPNNPAGGLDLRTTVNAIRGRSGNDIWAAGALGAMAHFDGTSWTLSDPGSEETMRALWLGDSTEVALGQVLDHVFSRGVDVPDGGAPSAGGWTSRRVSVPPAYRPAQVKFMSAWGAPGAEWIWCATVASTPGTRSGLWRLRPSSPTAFDLEIGVAANVCSLLGCSQMTSLHGSSRDALWAVGLTGATVRITRAESDAPEVTPFNSQTWNALNGVWAASDSDAWSVGARGTIRHYTGDPVLWDVVPDVPTIVDLNAIWGFSPSDVWAVGDGAVALHYDGKSWSQMKIAGLGARRPNLTAVWGAASGHVWIGGQGVILSMGGKP